MPSVNDAAYSDAAHLLRRAGFGAPPEEIQAATDRGLAATTDLLVNFEQVPDTIDDDAIVARLLDTMPERARGGRIEVPTQAIKMWWTYRMLASPRPLQEKMTLFWHNHFTSSDTDGALLIRQNQLYRTHALGNFRTLALAVSRDPAMLKYLNGNQNFKAHPNENYARELMELFTCGRVGPDGTPNYTEDDVKAGARSFSGWNMRNGNEFQFAPGNHDDDPKTFMGKTGDFNGDDIVGTLVALPATGYYICRKLFRFFAYSDPEPAVMNALVKTYFDSGYDIKSVVSVILHSTAFYSPKARFALVKSPVEYVVGTIKMTGMTGAVLPTLDEITDDIDAAQIETTARRRRPGNAMGRLAALAYAFRTMGQDILAPPNVKGWDGGPKWINTDTIQARGKFAASLADLPIAAPILAGIMPGGALMRPADFTGGQVTQPVAPADPVRLVNSILWRMGPLPVGADVKQALLDYANSVTDPQARVRGVFSLVLGTSEYQMC